MQSISEMKNYNKLPNVCWPMTMLCVIILTMPKYAQYPSQEPPFNMQLWTMSVDHVYLGHHSPQPLGQQRAEHRHLLQYPYIVITSIWQHATENTSIYLLEEDFYKHLSIVLNLIICQAQAILRVVCGSSSCRGLVWTRLSWPLWPIPHSFPEKNPTVVICSGMKCCHLDIVL